MDKLSLESQEEETMEAKGVEKGKKASLRTKLLKTACKLEISLSTFYSCKVHITVTKLIKEIADMTQNRLLKINL